MSGDYDMFHKTLAWQLFRKETQVADGMLHWQDLSDVCKDRYLKKAYDYALTCSQHQRFNEIEGGE